MKLAVNVSTLPFKGKTYGSSLKWVILVALVWFQFGYAKHDHHHALGDEAYDCNVCLQLESGDAMLGEFEPVDEIKPASRCLAGNRAKLITTEPFPHYSARASP